MSIRSIAYRNLTYHLVAFDEKGNERTEQGLRSSDLAYEAATDSHQPITDIFVISHGWMGDVPAAIRQYDQWLTSMAAQERDRAAARRERPGWRSLVVGLHWPSLPWGDERIAKRPALLSSHNQASTDVFAAENGSDTDTLVDAYAQRIADTPAARAALRTILSAHPDERRVLSTEVEDAYAVVFAESGLTCDGLAAPPGADQEGFVPAAIVAQAEEIHRRSGPAVLGNGVTDRTVDLVRLPLRQLSFWKMKDRARMFGEGGAHQIVRGLQQAAPNARIHLMGHSFGCIVVSGAVAGPTASSRPQPVDTLFLVQGALSLWAFTDDIPYQRGAAGYYSRIMGDRLIRGAVVTTRSSFDTAVGRFYPLGARLAHQKLLGDDLPAYGAIGTFGIQGVPNAKDVEMVGDRQRYDFSPGRVHNLEASGVIRNGRGPSGAHSDIAHPAVGHAFWQAALVAD